MRECTAFYNGRAKGECLWQVTPVLGMLLDMERQRQLPEGRRLCPKMVYLTYAMHYKQEAALLEKPLIGKAM